MAPMNETSAVDRPIARVAIFALSLGVLLLEIAFTRIFSFALWYHFTYVAISVGLLGYGAPGAFLSASKRLARHPPATLMVQSMLLASAGVLVALLSVLCIPLEPFSIASSYVQLFLMIALVILCSTPYFAAGLAMACAFRLTKSPNIIYFADLAGAGAGCALAIASIWILGAPGTTVISALIFVCAALLLAPAMLRRRYAAVGGATVVAAAALVLFVPFKPSGEKLLAKILGAGGHTYYSRWSPIFRVDVYDEPAKGFSAKRGVSPQFTGSIPAVRFIAHDGTAEAPMHEFHGDTSELDFLAENISAAPYLVANKPRVLVIGLGGGFDLINGFRNGASHITGVELDPLTVDVVRHSQADFVGHILSRPGVDVVVAEGRSFLRHSNARYDIIQLSGVDTLAALSTGAYMLAESYLYTVEAFKEFLQHLTPDGHLSLMVGDYHWKTGRSRFSLRHLTNFLAAAEQLGINDPAANVAILATGGSISTVELLVKPRAFTMEEIAALERFANEKQFEVWYLPGKAVPSPHTELLTADASRRTSFIASQRLDIRETPDNRPFFFHFYRWSELLTPSKWEVDVGHNLQTGQIVMAAILAVALISSVGMILVPLLLTRHLHRAGAARFAICFAGLGLGFMFIEISLIQQFILFLGHPTYSVATIMFALLIATGVGSQLSGNLSLSPQTVIRRAFMALIMLL